MLSLHVGYGMGTGSMMCLSVLCLDAQKFPHLPHCWQVGDFLTVDARLESLEPLVDRLVRVVSMRVD